MNVGYMKNDINNPIHNENCPICGKNIYVSKYYDDYACIDVNCALGHGTKELISKINNLLEMLNPNKKLRKLDKIDYSKSSFINIDGVNFRCSCGCNVFHHEYADESIYTCNICNTEYKGE